MVCRTKGCSLSLLISLSRGRADYLGKETTKLYLCLQSFDIRSDFLACILHVRFKEFQFSNMFSTPYRCQNLGHIRQRCASYLVCGHCAESGHGEKPCPNPHTLCTLPEHAHPPTGSALSSPKEEAIQELRVKDDFSFLDVRRILRTQKPRPESSLTQQLFIARTVLLPQSRPQIY
jgi:hypothetical protein